MIDFSANNQNVPIISVIRTHVNVGNQFFG